MDFLLLIIIFLPIISNLIFNSVYSKYSNISNNFRITGMEAARKILDINGLNDVKIVKINGNLSDNYNPQTKTVSLSNNIANGTSIASLAVAAHEVGHAIQDKENYSFLKFRSALVPAVNFTSRFASIFIILGLMLELSNLYSIGIIFVGCGLLFQFITLPVEFNASDRARKQLIKLNYITDENKKDVKKMLNAAAFTYVASFIVMLTQILRLIGLRNRD